MSEFEQEKHFCGSAMPTRLSCMIKLDVMQLNKDWFEPGEFKGQKQLTATLSISQKKDAQGKWSMYVEQLPPRG